MKRKKTIFVIESLLGLLMLVTACHKEDISTLFYIVANINCQPRLPGSTRRFYALTMKS